MEALFIPTLSFWLNGNTWYGSLGDARFFIQPVSPPEEALDTEGQSLSVKVWKGPLTLELSDVLSEAAFPLGEEGEGIAALSRWLEAQAEAINGG